MELRHIRYFLALAEELNYSRAAERLHISQPPLTRQIQQLEEELGVSLFHRTKRQVSLTDAGKAFLHKAYQMVDLLEQAKISARLASNGTDGEFRIGFTGAAQELAPFLQIYREYYPKVSIILKQMNNAQQIEALLENKIDIGLVSAPIKNEKIMVQPIKKMDFKAALPERHPLVNKSTLFVQDLMDETFIMTLKSAGPWYYETVMSAFHHTGRLPKITIQAGDLQTVLALVAAGMGVTITASPTNTVHGVVKRSIKDIDLALTASVAWRKDNHSEILKNFFVLFWEYFQLEKVYKEW